VSKVTKQCENFGKSKPTLTFYDKMKDELEESNQTWGLFEEFKKEMDVFAKEEWLTFRKKGYFAFQDFFLNQADKMKALPKNVVVKFLMIKLCTGESFEKEHWRRLITLLAMPKEVTFDNMKFGNLIDSVPAMLLKSKDIKDLADKAQGEVTIREAINELRTWCESTDFILSDYESNGRTTPLIREWKDVIT
jgi:dynein heavy chain 2